VEIKSRKVKQIVRWIEEAQAHDAESAAKRQMASVLEGTLKGAQFAELQQAKKERGL
jgi:hypothetical protein